MYEPVRLERLGISRDVKINVVLIVSTPFVENPFTLLDSLRVGFLEPSHRGLGDKRNKI